MGTLAGQSLVIAPFFASDLGFLWFNAIGCGVVVAVSLLVELVRPGPRASRA